MTRPKASGKPRGRKQAQSSLARKPLSKRLRERAIRVLEAAAGNALLIGLGSMALLMILLFFVGLSLLSFM